MKLHLNLFLSLFLFSILTSCQEKSETVELLPLKVNDGYHYYDTKGNLKINQKFASAGVFRNGLAIVKLPGNREQYTFIDEKGKNAFGKTYRNVTVFNEGLAWVSPTNSHPTAIDKNGKELFSIKDAEHVKIFKDGIAAYSKKDSISEKWGFVSTSGETIIQPKFYATGNFSEGLCAVKDEAGNWTYIDKKGVVKFEKSYGSATDFINKKAIVQNLFEEKFGVIDSDGNYLIEPTLDSIAADKDSFLIKKNDKWGWLDGTQKAIIEPQFDEAFPFGENELTVVKKNGFYGYIDKKGVVKIDFKFTEAYPFMGEIAYAKPKNSKQGGFIDTSGKSVVNPKFSGVSADLIAYLTGGNSSYEMIETDYFDIENTLKSINLNSPDGFSFNDKIAAITPKLFNKKVSSNTEEDLTISCMKKISSDAYLSSYLIRDKNDPNKINGFWYKVEIAGGRNFYKPNELEKALIKSLKGYKKIEAPNAFINQGRIKAFKNDKHFLLVTGENTANEFIVEILNLDTEIENFDSRSYSNHQKTDTDDSIYRLQRMELLRSED